MAGPEDKTPIGVHLVGSMPNETFDAPEEAWTKMFSALPGRLKRISDGELGERHYYVNWQVSKFPKHLRRPFEDPTYKADFFDPSLAPTEVEDIQPTGYDAAAIEGYGRFVKQREAGLIPAGVRFQVCLPLPIEPVTINVLNRFAAATYPFYEQRFFETLANIQKSIPAEDLAIQWDIAVTIALIEAERGNLDIPYFRPWCSNVLETSMEILKRFSLAVNPEVELGYHLCYGDLGNRPFAKQDYQLLTDIGNRIIEDVSPSHAIGWFQLPLPEDVSDEAQFAPLKKFKIAQQTQLFLGVVRYNDLEGTTRRIAAAQGFAPKAFGVSTICGMGRTPRNHLDNILDTLRLTSVPYE